MVKSTNNSKFSTSRALRRLGFRQSRKSALIIGLLCGVMMGAQGAAYAAAFPTQQSRDTLVASLSSTPALGFMAGEIRNASSPASYAIYKSITIVTLITGIWGILVATKLLRGQEEDGRTEALLAGRTTKAAASTHILVGFGYSIMLSFAIAWALIAMLGAAPNVNLDAAHAALLTIGAYTPAVFFGALGVLTSQLALTRGRALVYSLVPLLALFTLRGAANSISDWNDLKRYTPFGWTDLLNPVLDPQAVWIYPTLVFTFIAVPLGIYLAKKRDLGQSILPQSTHTRSRMFLLGSDLQFSVRQNISTFIVWCAGSLLFAGLLAAMAKLAANLLTDSPVADKVFTSLGLSQSDLVIAFMSLGGMFSLYILLFMTSVYIGTVRGQEAKGYLDNMLIQPISRSGWLVRKLVVILAMVVIISLLSGYAIWQVAALQGISIDFGLMMQNSITLTGTLFLLLGIGTTVYGFLPRLAVIIMIAVIIWADVSDILKAFFKLDDWIMNTSLLHYISFNPAKTPDWTQFAWLVCIGIVLMAIGVWRFTQRDIVCE
jgi:ABC-2 type transport system permease protein